MSATIVGFVSLIALAAVTSAIVVWAFNGAVVPTEQAEGDEVVSLTKDAIERVAARYKAGTLHAELCRLALLGLRVEEAPWTVAGNAWHTNQDGNGLSFVMDNVPLSYEGKRVRLVVEDQE